MQYQIILEKLHGCERDPKMKDCICREHERQERADHGDRAEHREPAQGLQRHQERPRTRRAEKEEGEREVPK